MAAAPRFRQDFLKTRTNQRHFNVPSFRALIADDRPVFLHLFPNFFQVGPKMGQTLSAIMVWIGRLGRAMGGPRFQEILARSRPVPHCRKRPSLRALIAAKDALFQSRLSIFSQRW